MIRLLVTVLILLGVASPPNILADGLGQQRVQTQMIITKAQRQILAELPLFQQQALRYVGFTPRALQRTVDITQGSNGWQAPGPPVSARVTGPIKATEVYVSANGQPVLKGELLLGEPLKPILRHEIGHQILATRGIPSGLHHRLQSPRGTKAELSRLSRLSVEQLMRLQVRGVA